MSMRTIGRAILMACALISSARAGITGDQSAVPAPILLAQAKSPAASPSDADGWKAIVTAAQKEGQVVVYSAQTTPVQDRLKADFSKLYPGIKLEMTRIIGVELLSRVEQERKGAVDGADVAVSSDIRFMEDMAVNNLLKPLQGPSARAFPAPFVKHGAVALITLDPFVIVYNTTLVKSPITGYQDILNPEFQNGKLATAEITASVISGWYDWLDKTQGRDFVAKFAAQKPRLYPGITASTQSLASGEVAVNAFSQPNITQSLIEKGAPLKMVLPSPSLAVAIGAGVLSWSKRPNAAMVYADYLMSARAQGIICGKNDCASPLPNIPGSLDARTISVVDTSPYTPEVLNAYRNKWNAMFKR